MSHLHVVAGEDIRLDDEAHSERGAHEDHVTLDERTAEDVRGDIFGERPGPQRHQPLGKVHRGLKIKICQLRKHSRAVHADDVREDGREKQPLVDVEAKEGAHQRTLAEVSH